MQGVFSIRIVRYRDTEASHAFWNAAISDNVAERFSGLQMWSYGSTAGMDVKSGYCIYGKEM